MDEIKNKVPLPPLPKYYDNIYELPLKNFEEVLINNNLSSLIVSGFPMPEQLQVAWTNILTEYTEALGTSEYLMYVNIYREFELLKLNIELMKICIATLRKNYSVFFINELKALMRVSYQFNIDDTDSYFADLDKCEKRIGGFKLNVYIKEKEFDAIKKKFEGDEKNGLNKKIDRNYFTSVLIVLSKHNSYKVTKDIFVNEYCEYLRQLEQYNAQNDKSYKKYSG